MVMQMFHRIQDDERFLDSIIFNDESTFHVSGKVNTHNCRIWGSENPRVSLEHVCDNPKVNVFCALSKERVYKCHEDENYRYRVSGHAPTVPHSTEEDE
jgi:hypothetical protein